MASETFSDKDAHYDYLDRQGIFNAEEIRDQIDGYEASDVVDGPQVEELPDPVLSDSAPSESSQYHPTNAELYGLSQTQGDPFHPSAEEAATTSREIKAIRDELAPQMLLDLIAKHGSERHALAIFRAHNEKRARRN